MKKTQFQQSFKRKDAIAITKIWHPDLTDEQIEKYIKFGAGSYDWCEINFKVPGYGQINLGLDNGCQYKLYGPRTSKEDIKNALEDGTIHFRVWRFCMDCKNKQEQYGSPELNVLETASREYLEKHYKLQSVEEFFNHYYSD